VDTLLDLLAPPRCAVCRAPGPLLCRTCLSALPLLDGPGCARCGLPAQRPVEDCASCRGRRLGFHSAAAALVYDGAARDLVHAFKDGGLRGLAEPAAALMTLVLDRPSVDVLTWVPPDPLRQALRGYHPARLLAECLARRWDLPARPLLRGPLWRRPQRGLSRAHRRANVRDAFTATTAVTGGVALVDDVHTTGATLTAAARALHRAGARQVVAITLARADRA
jgi:predicted amidophosphoribosyltransferase